MSTQLLRHKFMREFVGLEKYSRATAWVVMLAYVFQIVLAIAVGHYLVGLGLSPLTVLGSFFLMLFIATRLRGLNNIVHECSHASFSAHRPDNAVIGKICASIGMNCFADYRDEHLSHHAHLGDYERDMDLHGIKDLKLHEPLSRKVVLRHLTNPFLGRHLPYYLGINWSTRDGRAFVALRAGLLVAAALFTLALPATGILFVIVPFVFFYSTLNYWADCLDHAGLVAAEDDLDASRNIIAPHVVRWLFFPRNDCFHLVHHLFPNVPARHLERTHEALTADVSYRSRPNAVPQRGQRPAAPEAIPAE